MSASSIRGSVPLGWLVGILSALLLGAGGMAATTVTGHTAQIAEQQRDLASQAADVRHLRDDIARVEKRLAGIDEKIDRFIDRVTAPVGR